MGPWYLRLQNFPPAAENSSLRPGVPGHVETCLRSKPFRGVSGTVWDVPTLRGMRVHVTRSIELEPALTRGADGGGEGDLRVPPSRSGACGAAAALPAEESVVSPVFAECLAGPAGEACAP